MKALVALTIAVTIVSGGARAPDASAQSRRTPGTTALLVMPASAKDVVARGEAIGDPAVRAVAARVAGILNRKDLASNLAERLSAEDDRLAAAEQARALLFLESIASSAILATFPFADALASPRADIRRATAWFVLSRPGAFESAQRDQLRRILLDAKTLPDGSE